MWSSSPGRDRLRFDLEQSLEAHALAEARYEEALRERERLTDQENQLKDRQRSCDHDMKHFVPK